MKKLNGRYLYLQYLSEFLQRSFEMKGISFQCMCQIFCHQELNGRYLSSQYFYEFLLRNNEMRGICQTKLFELLPRNDEKGMFCLQGILTSKSLPQRSEMKGFSLLTTYQIF